MKLRIIAVSLLLLACISPAIAKVAIGEPAPDFTLPDSNGKTVVLEWSSAACPFLAKHYASGNMQKQQQEAATAGVVWMTPNDHLRRQQGQLHRAGPKALIAQPARQAPAELD